MTRLGTFRWTSPPPSAVDEVLVLEADVAWLVVRRPRRATSTVGSYVGRPDDEDRAALLAAAPGPVTFELWPPEATLDAAALMAVADRVAEGCLATPRATVGFVAAVTDVGADGSLGIALLATAAGTDPVVFELAPAASVVHLVGPGGEVTWASMPTPPTGFVTAQAVGIGGVGMAASLAPGDPVGTTFRVPDAAGATSIEVEVAGWLGDALPDEPTPEGFALRTSGSPIPR